LSRVGETAPEGYPRPENQRKKRLKMDNLGAGGCAWPERRPIAHVWHRGRGGTVGEALEGAFYADTAAVLYALAELGVIEVIRAVSPAAVSERPRPNEIDALDAEAIRARVRARVALVDEEDVAGVARATGEVDRQQLVGFDRHGEVTLADCGVLFLDELPEFDRDVLEALRQPLEDGRVSVARAGRSTTFPARFQLIAAMNPCPCGYAGSEPGRCRCGPGVPEKYTGRVSGPL